MTDPDTIRETTDWNSVAILRGQRIARLETRIRTLEDAVRELYDDAGVDDIDPRLDYVVAQIGRTVWKKFAALADDETPGGADVRVEHPRCAFCGGKGYIPIVTVAEPGGPEA